MDLKLLEKKSISNIEVLDYGYSNKDKIELILSNKKILKNINHQTKINLILMVENSNYDFLKELKIPKFHIKVLLDHAIRLQKKNLYLTLVKFFPFVLKSFIKKNNHLQYCSENTLNFIMDLFEDKNSVIHETYEFKNPNSFETHSIFRNIFIRGAFATEDRHWFFKDFPEKGSENYAFIEWIESTKNLSELLDKTFGFHGKTLKKLFYSNNFLYKLASLPIGLIVRDLFDNQDISSQIMTGLAKNIQSKDVHNQDLYGYFSFYSLSTDISFAMNNESRNKICKRLLQITSKNKLKKYFENGIMWDSNFIDTCTMLLKLEDAYLNEIKRYVSKNGFSFESIHYVLVDVLEKQSRANFVIKFKPYKKVMKVMNKYKEYDIKYPTDSDTLFSWGLDLNNCIGTADYSERARKNEILLCGLFINDELKYTVEISKNGTVIQCEGHDRKDISKRSEFNNFVKEKFKEVKNGRL